MESQEWWGPPGRGWVQKRKAGRALDSPVFTIGLPPETEKGWQVRRAGSPEARAVVQGERTTVSADH